MMPFEDLYECPSRNGLNRPSRVRGAGFKMVNMGELFAHDRISNIEMERVQLNEAELSSMLVEPGGAKSVFHFDVQGSVAKSTHSGIPWLRYIRDQLGKRVHFWPFDGWDVPAGHSAIAEAYQNLPHHELPFIKVRGRFCRNQKTHAAVLSPKKSGGFEINGV